MTAEQKYKWWRCPSCGIHGCAKTADVAADALKAHMLQYHAQWVIDSVAHAALTDEPQTDGSVLEMEPTHLPMEADIT